MPGASLHPILLLRRKILLGIHAAVHIFRYETQARVIAKKGGWWIMINGYEDFQKAGRDGMNRARASIAALSRGWQTLATESAGYSKQAFEDGAAHFEKMLGVKSVEGAIEAQTSFVQAAYEKAVGQASRFGELYLGVVKDVAKPFEDLVPASK
jgi:phasin family protein